MLKEFLNLPIVKLTRISRPTGIFLLFVPCAFSIVLFAPTNYEQLLLFFIGSCLMRSSGCIINDIFDRNLDSAVERTKNRPLACGEISVKSSLILLCVLLAAGLVVLIQLNSLAIKISLFSTLMVIAYPLIKRISHFPQVFLGFTFNIGALVAAANIVGFIPKAAIIIYIGCIFWTMAYDTVYGFMDIVDDKKAGIKSLAIKIEGPRAKLWLGVFYSIFIGCSISAQFLITQEVNYYILIIYLLLMYQLYILELQSTQSCYQHFASAPIIGILTMAALWLFNLQHLSP